MNPRSPLDADNLLTLVRRMREQLDIPSKLKVTAKTLEIHAPDRVVAFLAKLVQLDAAKLQSAAREDAGGVAAELERRFGWIEGLVAGSSAARAAAPAHFKSLEIAGQGAGLRETALQAMKEGDGSAVTGEGALLALELACLVAYFELTPPKTQIEASAELASALPMVAIALSTVAPVWHCGAEPAQLAASADLQERLFTRAPQRPRLDGLGIRLRDLRAAIAVLREARMSFGARK